MCTSRCWQLSSWLQLHRPRRAGRAPDFLGQDRALDFASSKICDLKLHTSPHISATKPMLQFLDSHELTKALDNELGPWTTVKEHNMEHGKRFSWVVLLCMQPKALLTFVSAIQLFNTIYSVAGSVREGCTQAKGHDLKVFCCWH